MAAAPAHESEPDISTDQLSRNESTPAYHPSFRSTDADVILCSADGVLYRIHSYILRTTSGLFRTLFSLPQPEHDPPTVIDNDRNFPEQEGCVNGRTPLKPEVLPTHESSEVLTLLLSLLLARPLPSPITDWGDASSPYGLIERVLALAEAWDAPGAIAAIRPSLCDRNLIGVDPLRLYAIASHFGWKAEKKLSSMYTLGLDLLSEEADNIGACRSGHEIARSCSAITRTSSSKEGLARLSSRDLLALFKLRRRRCDIFRSLIDSQDRFTAGNSSHYQCARCGVTPLDNRTWRAFKHAMMMEMDRRPLGDGIIGGKVHGIGGKKCLLGVIAWPEADACWEARCTKEGCGGFNYDRSATLKQIKSCVDVLPLHVEG